MSEKAIRVCDLCGKETPREGFSFRWAYSEQTPLYQAGLGIKAAYGNIPPEVWAAKRVDICPECSANCPIQRLFDVPGLAIK